MTYLDRLRQTGSTSAKACAAPRRIALVLLALATGCSDQSDAQGTESSGGRAVATGGQSTLAGATSRPGTGRANGGAGGEHRDGSTPDDARSGARGFGGDAISVSGKKTGGVTATAPTSGGSLQDGGGGSKAGALAGSPSAARPNGGGLAHAGRGGSSGGVTVSGGAVAGGARPSSTAAGMAGQGGLSGGGGAAAGQPTGGVSGASSSSGGNGGMRGCSTGFEYLVPGCSLRGTPFDAGCYQRCESTAGQTCPTEHQCLETTINPCVCDPGQICCAACGMSAWVCLPAAPACQTDARETMVLSAANSFGMCAGECRFELTVERTSISASACDEVTLVISDARGAALPRSNSGRLTALGHERVRELAAGLVGIELQSVYGCPDCDDGGASRITLSRNGSTSSHEYDYSDPPAPLVDADSFVQELIRGLRQCENSGVLSVDDSCTS